MKEHSSVIERKYRKTESSEEYTPLSSFRFSDVVRFSLEISKEDQVDTAVLRIHRDSDGGMFLLPMKKGEAPDKVRCFTVELSMSSLCADENGGLFYYCYDVYYPEGCVTYAGEEPETLSPKGEVNKRQLLVYRDDFHTPDWMRGGILYHIFVDRFCRGAFTPLKKGAVRNPNWENGIPQFGAYPGAEVANNEFFGGDLYGIAQKLDYIASLGVTCLYLSPIFDAASNHKYDTGDYEHVDAMFGGDAALDHLLMEAGKRGIRVILDGVFNHTGADSRYFNRRGTYDSVGAWQSKDSPFYSWYSFKCYPDEYDCWWGVKILPKVRCDEPSYRDYILGDNGIVQKWMHRGIAGWRLDVADELSDGFLHSLRERVRSCASEAVIYGEVWENATNKIAYGKRRQYLCGNQLDSVMNYPLRNAVIAYIRDGDSETLRSCVNTIYRQYPKESADVLMNFLGTHDTARILTELGGRPAAGNTNEQLSVLHMSEEERRIASARLKIAYQLISVMPGLPCIFYGDEAGIEGYGDPFCRRTFPWGHEDQELISFYRKIGLFHRKHPVFRDGYIRLVYASEKGTALLRYNGRDPSILLLLNRTEQPITVTLSCSVNEMQTDTAGKTHIIEPMSGRFFVSAFIDLQANIQ